MSISYQEHKNFPKDILIRDFEGDVDVNQIINSWEELLKQGQLNPGVKGVINNLTSCNLLMDIQSFEYLLAYLKTRKEFKSIKLAVLCNSPEKIVFPFLGEMKVKELRIKPFTTEDAAVNWIIN